MRIGELARQVGVSTDTVRFYERSGWLPRAPRRANDYREYGEPDVEHLRLLIDLRRLDISLDDAARIAGWCHSGHCADTTAELPFLIGERRAEIADRIAGLQTLDARLVGLQGHLERPRRPLAVVDVAEQCCEAADAVVGSAEGACACCAQVVRGPVAVSGDTRDRRGKMEEPATFGRPGRQPVARLEVGSDARTPDGL